MIRDIFAVRLVAYFVTGLLTASCTKSVHVPRTSYNQVNSSQAKFWRVTTTEGIIYWVEHFTITDATLVIEQASRFYSEPDETEPQNILESNLPIVLPLSEVAALERRVINLRKTFLVLAPFVLVGYVLYGIGKAFENLGGS